MCICYTLVFWAVLLLLAHVVVQPEPRLGAHCSVGHIGCGVRCSEVTGGVDIPKNYQCPEAEMHPQNSHRCCQEQPPQRETCCAPVSYHGVSLSPHLGPASSCWSAL